LLGMVQYTRHMAGMMMHGGRTPTPPPPEKVKHPDLWKKLLADERPAAGRLTGPGTTTVGDTAAWMLESLYPSPDAAVLQWVRALGRRVLPLIRKRAEERLAGAAAEELSPLPSADNVSEEDLDALLAKLRDPQETTAVLSALSLDELLALRAPFSEQSNLWARAAVPAHRVRDVRIAESLAETFPGLAALEGQPLDPEILDTLIAQSLQQAAGGTPLTVAIQRHAGFEGVTIMAQAIDTNKAAFAAWAAHLRNADPEGRPMVTVNLSFPRRHAAAVWYGEPQIAVEPEPDPEESNDLLDAFEDELASDAVDSAVENRKMLQKTWRECLVPRCDVYPGASVVLTAVPATPPEE